ncbi:type IV-A pilus assembly ATPase PilB [Cellvibrio japonicus]|uniref:PilB protein n=1 Tax=Cellvibrio japonicus (strain Ueda107) TaxID=498211 RepID=B3PBG3_CELJU|nr:type IV-A pilus assembly ATPase PilB [Cellvibrio japonicus]ACE83223.1 PilB protein [Cellvibrio japonicus Ueda107]QEI13079.1 type IV-A pilus assembly ATPase PilB [Cellvibrio japonicus]QEI16653.1 type IV-A pilus assembly ATPase PilB [Cellvibrio japonicus]QEI20231.1 type IV-A pilus assembly ATPase PilB [Cellvibrio japonicus]
MNTPVSSLSGLARRLVSDNLLDPDLAGKAIIQAKKDKVPFVHHLVSNGILDARIIARVAAEEFGTPVFDLGALNKDTIPQKLVDEKLIRKHQTLPLSRRGNRLFLAVADPTDLHALDEIKFNTGINTEAVLVEADKLKSTIEKYLSSQEEPLSLGDGLDSDLEDLDVETIDTNASTGDESTEADEAPIVKYINKVLLDAIKGGSSDIHFEPYEKSYRVRFRTDGVLHEVSRPPVNLATRMAARLKVMSQMDISERRVPQDGRIKLKVSKTRAIDFRVNTLPTLFGEKIVLRILDPSSAKLGIDALGYEDNQKKLYLDALAQSQGMILVTGPTGSGKTVSLYTGLNILNTAEVNISTAEDPVEINLEGINQVQMNTRVGLTFAEALRSFLRQDPDVIMVGEIRDLETAEIAIKASQTGHLVLSTLHTNSAPETLTRLLNMGVPAFNVATSVSLIIAQRLARRLCPTCRKPATDIPEEILKQEGFDDIGIPRAEFQLFHPVGCDKCNGGYKGRVGVYEVVRITPEIANLIMEGGNSLQIARVAKEAGFNNLRVSALRKVAMGLTSLEEANRVTKD